jgi:hypothetical protein
MKKGKNHSFKVGDVVYTKKNSSWGMKPMVVQRLIGDGISCKHPDFPTGWFPVSECELATRSRKLALDSLKVKMDEVNRIKRDLFNE